MGYRSPGKILLFTIITFGIYGIYWAYSTREELVRYGAKIPSIASWLVPLSILLTAYAVVFILMTVDLNYSMDNGGASSSAGLSEITIWVAIIAFLGLIGTVIAAIRWIYAYCVEVRELSEGKISLEYSLGLFLLTNFFGVGLIWPALMQREFNR